jgi:hypothetical protein
MPMQMKKTIEAGIVATSVMTAFSYALSAMEKENYKEPQLLSGFVKGWLSKENGIINYSGWLVHYTLGCTWAGVYTLLNKQFSHKVSSKHAFLFGCISGAIGVLTWKALFEHHPHPPKTAHRKFYRQLFAAHLLFAFSLAKAYTFLHKENSPVRNSFIDSSMPSLTCQAFPHR